MKIYLDCYPCFVRQTLDAGRIAGADEKTQKRILSSVMQILADIPDGATPPKMGRMIHETVKDVTGNPDPYKEIKRQHNEAIMEMEQELADRIGGSPSPLEGALKLAGTGNLIDMGPERRWSDIHRIFDGITTAGEQTLFLLDRFEETLHQSQTLLYLGDNAGEIVLDKLLIGLLLAREPNLDITFAVRGGPIINDATREDAELIGLADMVRIIDTGAAFPGVELDACSHEFLECYFGADLILAKGQGNYESLSNAKETVFFLLTAKCPVIADDIGCDVGDLVLWNGDPSTNGDAQRFYLNNTTQQERKKT